MATAAAMKTQHSFKRGDRVAVFAQTLSGRYTIEGHATIMRPVKERDEAYIVAFPDGRYERFVDPAGQADPQAYLAKLNESR